MLVNTQLFREAAIRFEKYGNYCDAPAGTKEWLDYWTRERDRRINGYSVGGVWISGHFYNYLNYVRYKRVADADSKRRRAKKEVGFPAFWDGDYLFFKIQHEAEQQGKHLVVAKARRKGYSQKMANMASNTYDTVRHSLTILGAFEKKYLYPKGIMSMALENLSFMDTHTAWGKKRQEINRADHVKASYKQKMFPSGWVTKGYMSEIMAVTYQDNPDAARGKDANYVILDEGGVFDNLKASLAATRPCVEAGGVATGQLVLFGTGGDMEGGTIDLESIFYSPEEHGFLGVPNEWDEDGGDGLVGYFHPCFMNKEGFMDKDGNSKIVEAKHAEQEKRDFLRQKSKDPNTYDKYITEYPFNPKEAFLRTGNNLFPVALASEWRNAISRSKDLSKIGTYGFMKGNPHTTVEFKPSPDARPLLRFPHDRSMDTTGCVIVYQSPYRSGGKVPENLYYAMHDPYAGDSTPGSMGRSLGVTYIKKRINKFSYPDDMIVASYIGRPLFQDTYNDQMFALAHYYNAKISFENDRGEVVPYARRNKLLHMLYEEFELYDAKENFTMKSLGRKWGTSMGSGHRKRQGELYFKDWLMTPRGMDENGEHVLNLHTIYDVGLLDEIIRYDPFHGNFDRISACLVGTFAEKDLYNKEPKRVDQVSSSGFFQREFFV